MFMPVFQAGGVKACPGMFGYRQPDGTEIKVRAVGDEHFHYYTDAEGRILVPDAEGKLTVQPGGLSAVVRKAPVRVSGVSGGFPTEGDVRSLVVLVEFPDRTMRNSRETFTQMLNEPGYSGFGATGSARDWFMDNSYGVFRPEFDVYGPVQLGHEASYYSANDDALAHHMVAEALRALDSSVDFKEYDVDNDGWIDNIYVIYAGYGRADGGGYDTVWPHSSNLYKKGERLSLDGVMAGSYSCSNELRGGTQSVVGIGTFCHEFCHVLGLPDLYSTNGAEVSSPDKWSVMDQGNYCNNGRTPVALSAYEKEFLGWIDPVMLDCEATLRLPADLPLAYRVAADADSDEYFLLECRRRSGWDAYLPGEGMLVWHIDYDRTAWENNAVNNDPSRPRVDILRAAGGHYAGTDPGDPFPGNKNITCVMLGDYVPSINCELTDISFNGYAVTLNAGASTQIPAAPTGLVVSEVSDCTALLKWDNSEDATGYYVSVTSEENGRQRAVAHWTMRIADTNQLVITDLQPETEYSASVCARNGITAGEASEVVKFTTDLPGLSFFTPELLEPVDITENSFIARWHEMELATSYQVTVSELRRGEPQTECATFSPDALPDGWNTNSSESISVSGYYGESAPALRLSGSGSFLQTAECPSPFTSLSFWLRGYRSDAEARLLVKVRANGTWSVIDEIAPSRTEGSRYTYTPDGATAARLEWSNPAENGSACIDDVTLEFTGAMHKEIIVDSADTGGKASYTVTGLNPGTRYYYTVRGTDGGVVSLPSEEDEVCTAGNSSGILDTAGAEVSICRSGDSVYVQSPAETIAIMTVSGVTVAEGTGALSVALPRGIYVIMTGGTARKIRL